MANIKLKSKNGGYTLLEVMLAVSIAMAISGWAVLNTRGIVLKQKGHAAAIALFKELQALPPIAMKTDRTIFVRLNPTGTDKYRVFIDKNGDGTLQTGSDSLVLSLNKPDIDMAFPDPAPTAPVATGVPQLQVVDGDWGSAANTIIVSNNSLNSINSGALYLRNSQLPNQGYCIYLKPSTRTLKLKFWDGSTWITL